MGDRMTQHNALISAEALFKIINDPKVKIIDASYGLPELPVKIGNAVDFDIDDIANPDSRFLHTLPSPEIFSEKVGKLGIANDDTVVVYDRNGISMAAARAWWMFRIFGHDNVYVLDGGLPAWVAREYDLTPKDESDPAPAPAVFLARLRPELHKVRDEMLANIDNPAFQVLDARDPARYSGAAPEPRPGMEGGHIPGSVNLPFMNLIDAATGQMKPSAELVAEISQTGVDPQKPIAISCGSGVTACVVALALHQTGAPDAAIYGGSWTEWGGDRSLPKKKGNEP